MAPRNTHVLFIHGVGNHARLSSLLRGYQSLREELKSPDLPSDSEDLIVGWRLADFNEDASLPSVTLSRSALRGDAAGVDRIHLYEVNYSQLAGIIRENHPIDLTRLFVSFDLTVLLAHQRMAWTPPVKVAGEINDMAVADSVKELTGLCIAATVPILGIFPRVARWLSLQNVVETFTRFFEDVATFSMDISGSRLISTHVDRTVRNIVNSPHYEDGDELVIVAHSLGTVVAHNHLVRHWADGGKEVPNKILTFGSPIGLLCWLWLFMDFSGMEFSRRNKYIQNFFTWFSDKDEEIRSTMPGPAALKPVVWANIVNHLDPIATAFPGKYAFMSAPQLVVQSAMGEIQHRFIKTSGLGGIFSAHMDYFNDRPSEPKPDPARQQKFLDYLLGFVEFWKGGIAAAKPDASQNHWANTRRSLLVLAWMSYIFGALALLGYFLLVEVSYPAQRLVSISVLLPIYMLYLWPGFLIAVLSFFQRLVWGSPTKRISSGDIEAGLAWNSWDAFPYKLRMLLSERSEKIFAPRYGWKVIYGIVSLLPFFIVMTLPVLGSTLMSGSLSWHAPSRFSMFMMFSLFLIHLVSFVLFKILKCWRAILDQVTS